MLSMINPPPLYLEIGPGWLQLVREKDGVELPLERQENGQLTPACKERVVEGLRGFLRLAPWLPKPRAYCAIAARGVSLRRVKVPPASGEEFQRLMRLQIESEFPLPPDELAWGCQRVKTAVGAVDSQEWVVAAVKKEILQEYAAMFAECGLDVVFTLGALARRGHCPGPPDACAVLDIGAQISEWVGFEQGLPGTLRVLAWGDDNVLSAVQKQLGGTREQAVQWRAQSSAISGEHEAVKAAVREEWEVLAAQVRGVWKGQKIFVTGPESAALAAYLGSALGGVDCVPLGAEVGKGQTAATLGLRHFCEQNGGAPPLVFEAAAPEEVKVAVKPMTWRWAALAAALAVGALALRYVEPLLFQAHLARQIAETKTKRDQLPNIDREYEFLQYLRTNQAPYLEAVATLSKSAVPGMKLESLALSRRGDFAFKGYVRDMQQAVDFRGKLVDSGFFTNVVMEEQSPTPDRQKMNMRLIAQWRPVAAREVWLREMAKPENATNAPVKPMVPTGGGMPPNMGMPMPMGMPSTPMPGPRAISKPPSGMARPPGMVETTAPFIPPPEGGPPIGEPVPLPKSRAKAAAPSPESRKDLP